MKRKIIVQYQTSIVDENGVEIQKDIEEQILDEEDLDVYGEQQQQKKSKKSKKKQRKKMTKNFSNLERSKSRTGLKKRPKKRMNKGMSHANLKGEYHINKNRYIEQGGYDRDKRQVNVELETERGKFNDKEILLQNMKKRMMREEKVRHYQALLEQMYGGKRKRESGRKRRDQFYEEMGMFEQDEEEFRRMFIDRITQESIQQPEYMHMTVDEYIEILDKERDLLECVNLWNKGDLDRKEVDRMKRISEHYNFMVDSRRKRRSPSRSSSLSKRNHSLNKLKQKYRDLKESYYKAIRQGQKQSARSRLEPEFGGVYESDFAGATNSMIRSPDRHTGFFQTDQQTSPSRSRSRHRSPYYTYSTNYKPSTGTSSRSPIYSRPKYPVNNQTSRYRKTYTGNMTYQSPSRVLSSAFSGVKSSRSKDPVSYVDYSNEDYYGRKLSRSKSKSKIRKSKKNLRKNMRKKKRTSRGNRLVQPNEYIEVYEYGEGRPANLKGMKSHGQNNYSKRFLRQKEFEQGERRKNRFGGRGVPTMVLRGDSANRRSLGIRGYSWDDRSFSPRDRRY